MLERLKVAVDKYADSDDITPKVKEILFPLICEEMGYGWGSKNIVSQCLYGANKNEAMDYGVIDDLSNNTFIMGIVLVRDDRSFSRCRDIMESSCLMNPGVKYGVVTDCVKFEFYENILDGANSTGVQLVRSFDIRDPSKDDEAFMQKLKASNKGGQNPMFADDEVVIDDFDAEEPEDDDEYNQDVKQEIISDEPKKKKKAPKEPSNLEPILKKALPIALGIAVLGLIAFLLFTFLRGDTTNIENPEVPLNNIANIDWNEVGDIDPDKAIISDLSYIELQGMIQVRRLDGDILQMSLLNTNILDGAVIKFKVFCDNNTGSAYAIIKNGECSTQYQIPATWANPDVTVVAYMRFDETGVYQQPSAVREKYGETGQNIVQKEGAPLYGVAYTTTTHENLATIDYINAMLTAQQNSIKASRDKDFAQVEYEVDFKGNIKIVPKYFSLSKANVTASRHVYPYIFYDASINKSYFYLVCGYLGKDYLDFTSVNFYADTYSWGYQQESNLKQKQLGTMIVSEWIYFSDDSILTILNDMNLLASSKEASVKFSGPMKREFEITQEEKDNIAFFLHLYNDYFGNGTKVPDTSWFDTKGDPIDMSYIKVPAEVKMRGSLEIAEMETMQNNINLARVNGRPVPQADQTLFDQMQRTYKPVDNEVVSAICTSIINSEEAYAIYDLDEEHGQNTYMKFYFEYDSNQGSIESGYIPYVIIYSNKMVHIPLVTVDKSTADSTRTLVELELDQETYDFIVSTMNKVGYQYYGQDSTMTAQQPQTPVVATQNPNQGTDAPPDIQIKIDF